MRSEKETLPEDVRHQRAERAREQQTNPNVFPQRVPVHHKVMADRGLARFRKHSFQKWPFGHGHVHPGVALHDSLHAFLGLAASAFDQARRQESFEEQSENHNHDGPADKFGERKLPAHQNDHDDAEFDHQIRRGELKRDRRGEVRALAKDGTRQSHRRVRARRRRRAEAARN